jgi:tRNA(fMet)-specific endonuclease VapC
LTLLFDTNVCIDILRGTRRDVRARYAEARAADLPIGLSVLVFYELEVGVRKSADPARARAKLDAFLRVSPTPLEIDSADAAAAADIRARLERVGKTIGPVDTLLAGQAIARGAVFMASNFDEFVRVASLRVVRATDSWISD